MKGAEAQLIDALTSQEVVPLLRKLIQIPSAGSAEGEGAVADFVAAFLEENGIETELQEVAPGRPNVIGRLGPAEGHCLLFNAHMDVVPAGEGWSRAPYAGIISDDKVYGRGAVDDKGPLAAMLAAAVALKMSETPLQGQLLMCAVVDEEGASLGSKHLLESHGADLALVGEPTGGELVIAHNGSMRPMLKAVGRAGHTSRPEEGVNAIYMMAEALLAIRVFHAELSRRRHPLTGSASITVSMIKGGEQPNVIPDRCEALLDRRLIPGETEEQALGEISALLDETMTRHPEAKVFIDRLIPTTGGPSQISPDAPLVELVRRAALAVSGHEPSLRGMRGACDMVHLINAGIPAVVFGPGDPGQAHKADEHIRVDDLVSGARIYALLALRYLGQRNEARFGA